MRLVTHGSVRVKRLVQAAARARQRFTRSRRPDGSDLFTRLEPVSRSFGLDRGQPIDRFYIERFLDSKSDLITGRVLEIGGRDYTERFGRHVTQSDVLHATADN